MSPLEIISLALAVLTGLTVVLGFHLRRGAYKERTQIGFVQVYRWSVIVYRGEVVLAVFTLISLVPLVP